MNIKRIFGALLVVLGIDGLICAVVLLVNISGGMRDIKALGMYAILGLMFFIIGIGLLRAIKVES
jgi:hypothetical protein